LIQWIKFRDELCLIPAPLSLRDGSRSRLRSEHV